MKYIFFGTPEFAAIILEKLIKAGLAPVAVITNPDRPVGRKKILTPPPVKKLISNFKIRKSDSLIILQPEKLDENFKKELEKYRAEVFVVAAYGKILPKWLIEIPLKGTIGVHPSLLPKYRGATPIQNTILAGEGKTGTTVFLVDEKVDHGPILANSEIRISNYENYEGLLEKLANLSADLLIKILPKYLRGDIKPQEQDHNRATYTRKFTANDSYVNLETDDSKEIWRKVRALNPEPGVWILMNEKSAFAKATARRVKILEADFIDGKLVLKKIQVEGKKAQIKTTVIY